MTERAHILLAITVYNGRAFVPEAIRSARAISTANHDLDIVVLDDHSPAAGWSEDLAQLCEELGIRYYCSPRNLGIPRNVNLALLAAVDAEFTHVIVANSDVLLPANLLDVQVAACESDERIASVTAWSNNASMYSLPVDDASVLNDQAAVDWLSNTLHDRFDNSTIDVPAGISFCIMIPTWAVTAVGLMDPVFGRGYCEETDWSRRSLALGFRCTVATGVFVYHAGKGSNESAGLLRPGATSVDEHEAIVDMRYPTFRAEVAQYAVSGVLERLHDDAALAIGLAGAKAHGYSVEVGYLGPAPRSTGATITIDPSGSRPVAAIEYLGFRAALPLESGPGAADVGAQIIELTGSLPTGVNLLDRGPRTQHLLDSLGVVTDARPIYPARV